MNFVYVTVNGVNSNEEGELEAYENDVCFFQSRIPQEWEFVTMIGSDIYPEQFEQDIPGIWQALSATRCL